MSHGIAVIGGAYRERIEDPFVNVLAGSGLRAAKLVRALGYGTLLHTFIDSDNRVELESQCALFELSLEANPRSHAIEFHYETPIDKPLHCGQSKANSSQVNVESALVFGMLERNTTTIEAERVVIDPQHSPIAGLRDAVTAEHVAFVLNEHEARRLTGATGVREAATTLLKQGAQVVVVKCGARGGVVASKEGFHQYGVVPTESVNPVGSGDAFSAGFFCAWALEGLPAFEAAQFATKVAAAHSLVGSNIGHLDVLDSLGEPMIFGENVDAQVYLASPFFDIGERSLMRKARDGLLGLGVSVFSPLDEIGKGGDEVAQKDLDGLQNCQALLALLPGADAGTLFEAGWATKAGIPVVGYDTDQKNHYWTMLRGTGALITDDLSTAVYQAAWKALDGASS